MSARGAVPPPSANEALGLTVLSAAGGFACGFALARQSSSAAGYLSGGGGGRDTSLETKGGGGERDTSLETKGGGGERDTSLETKGGGGGRDTSLETTGGGGPFSGDKGFLLGSALISGAVFAGLWLLRKSFASSGGAAPHQYIDISDLPGKSVPFAMEEQEETEWCWAAVTQSVDRFFVPSSLSQCDIAHQHTGLDCCGNRRDDCNAPEQLDPPLQKRNLLNGQALTRQLHFEEVKREIDAGRPVCVRVGWLPDTTYGHFVAITGYRFTRSGRPVVIVKDPKFEGGVYDWDAFTDTNGGYRLTGRWNVSFLVQKPA